MKTETADFLATLKTYNPCVAAFKFASQFDSWQAAWDACERGDWMLWIIAKTTKPTDDRKPIVRVACACARLALPYTKDPRVLACIETTEAWTRGEATTEEVRIVRNGAYDAAYAAAYAAADAAYAAYAAADADAAYADADADAAYAADARQRIQKQCAEIVRLSYPTAPTLTKLR